MKYPFRNLAGLLTLAAALLGAGLRAEAQPGMPAPQFDGAMEKLFGDHKNFSAALEFQTEGGATPMGSMTIDGGMECLNGMFRFEMDMTKLKGSKIPPEAIAQMKQMGMDKMVTVSLPEAKMARVIYPSMKAYVEMPIPHTTSTTPASEYKSVVTELGSETVGGHACKKNKVVVTGPDGVAREATVWNATDLDKFPVKIDMNDNGTRMSMTFADVKLDKPDAALFDAPAGFKKYDSAMSLMMSRIGGGGAPGAQ